MATNLPPPPASDAVTNGLRDIVGPVPIFGLREWLLSILAAALVLAAIAALLLWWRARRRRSKLPPPAPPPLPAHVRARAALDEALRWLSDPDRFCTEHSLILRRYLEERFGWNAPDRTTEEFLAQLHHQKELPDGLRGLLEDFLVRCDRVKFARHDPTEAELQELHRAAVRIVADTVPPPPPSREEHANVQPASVR